ncbi:glycine zipper 2TM domain-containing protein [Cupriavidus sp. BIS7]|uniref:glycine zipper 2TM domain-containing protein n=1 Tax=Cupriavidus sp. BIS7 TaxID=1217718 RepID=UPI0003182BE8|nr:glycine zipper 2TM domain-containing protein [Cupriavidus sp. BIS7]
MSGPETLPTLPTQRRLNPLIGAAAISIVIVSLTAVAALTGVLPISNANQGSASTEPSSAQSQYYSGQVNAPATTQAGTQTEAQAQAPAPGSTTRPPAYDRQYAQNSMPAAPAQQQQLQQPTQAQQPQQAQPSQAEPNTAARPSHTAGHVTGVQVVEAEKPTTGLGAVGGAVVGGLLGNQIGHGNGRILGTVAGAAAGGFGGNYAEKKLNTNKSYRVSVQMDDGSHRTFTYQNAPGVEVGQRVHLEHGALVTG